MTGTLYCQQAPSFGWDVKPRSWLSVVIKNPMALLVKSRGVTPVSWPSTLHWPLSIIHLIGSISLSSPPVAGVWWAHWRHCPVAVVASSRRDPPPPHMIVKCFGCTTIHNKALYNCIIHSFIHPFQGTQPCCKHALMSHVKNQWH